MKITWVCCLFYKESYFYLIPPAHIFRTATLGCTKAIYCYAESDICWCYIRTYAAQKHISLNRMVFPKIMRNFLAHWYTPTVTFGTGYKYWISSTDEYIDRSSSEYLRMSGVLLSICTASTFNNKMRYKMSGTLAPVLKNYRPRIWLRYNYDNYVQKFLI